MWKCVFDEATGKGVAFGRDAGDGEFLVEREPSECGWFNAYPERYQYLDGGFSERPEWEQEQADKEFLANAERTIRERFATESEAPVTVTVTEGTFIFNGGEDSASAISGAVQLAQALGETVAGIWDTDNVVHELSFESAMAIAAQVALAWRTAAYRKQTDLVALANGTYTGE